MLHKAMNNALEQVLLVIDRIDGLPNSQVDKLYLDASIGRHVRHITDHFLALKNGLDVGIVDYNQRNRDCLIESDTHAAKRLLLQLVNWIDEIFVDNEKISNVSIDVFSEIDCFQTVSHVFKSCCEREFLYLINHTIHHVAYIKLLAQIEGVIFPEHIGIAPSTATFLRDSMKAEPIESQSFVYT